MTDTSATNPGSEISNFVRGKVHQLVRQNGDVTPTSRALLAQLRQASGQEPGTAPSIWSVTLDGLPHWNGIRRERLEAAVHIALTQFAVHQQSKAASMHGVNRLGSAVRALTDKMSPGADVYETPVYRRFTALMASTTLPGIRAHLRGLITQMRSEGITLDYGSLASDLYWLQSPATAGKVRRAWGRDFQRLTTTSSTETTNEEESK